ncbi:FecR domain-containing protein [Porticoccaceae bacterium LTM1]|nr:FecR domain-containing protein [Porticoccaceae bacterium LTM1]
MEKILQNFRELRAAKAVTRLFSEDISGKDEAELQAWQKEGSAFKEDYLDMIEALADLEGLVDDPEILAVAEETYREPADKSRQSNWPVYAMAASLVLAAVVGIRVLVPFGEESASDINVSRYATRVGEQKVVNLPDGSEITLNTGSLMLVEMSKNQRRIILEHGEAYFAVAPDESRPFTVDLGERSVTVLGTEFNILKSPESFTLAVVEGMVSLHRKEEPVSGNSLLLLPDRNPVNLNDPGQVRLVAGNVAEFNSIDQELLGFHDKDVSRFQVWRTGKLYFDEVPLYKVVHELNRYSGKKIMVEDAAVMDLKIYAAVDLKYPDEVLIDLEKVLPIRIIRHFDRTIIVGKKQ